MSYEYDCNTADHFRRRTLLKLAGLSGLSFLTPLGSALAAEAGRKGFSGKAKSLIILWLEGGPSQIDTFDPKPGTKIGGPTKAIDTAVKGVQLAEGLEQTAALMQDISLIRSVVSREGDHARAAYNMNTGYRPNPSIMHPSIGSVICHQLAENKDAPVEIPRHISILSNRPSRGGALGARYDAFRIGDPANRIPDLTPRVEDERFDRRLENLSVVDRQFARGRRPDLEENITLHDATMRRAMNMMNSDQLKAFDVNEAPAAERAAYGDSPFGRGCMAAVRLIETGVRCVEVRLGGFDTHFNNHETHMARKRVLDPAFASLIKALKERDLFDSTIVLCGGEFGRTPKINPAEGRDHWPTGFSVALAGGGIGGGRVIGETDSTGEKKEPKDPVPVQNIHTTILSALNIDPHEEYESQAGRPIKMADGKVIKALL